MSYYPDPESKAESYASRIDELEAELKSLRELRDLVSDFVPVMEGKGLVATKIRILLAGMKVSA